MPHAWMRNTVKTLGLVSTLFIAGCVTYKSSQEAVTADIPDVSFLAQISFGETRTDWLIEQFGKPSAVRRPDDHTAVWQYENVTRATRQIRAMPLLAIETKSTARTIYSFEVENGFIVRYWKESGE